jgi:hypothetical protein
MWNWGRWSRIDEDAPRLSAPILWRMMKRDDSETSETQVDDRAPPIDHMDAVILQRSIDRLAMAHYRVLWRRFYKWEPIPELELGASLRALQDV